MNDVSEGEFLLLSIRDFSVNEFQGSKCIDICGLFMFLELFIFLDYVTLCLARASSALLAPLAIH